MAQRYPKPKDRKCLDVNDPQELLAVAQYLGKRPQEVAFAHFQVGPEVDAIAAFLRV